MGISSRWVALAAMLAMTSGRAKSVADIRPARPSVNVTDNLPRASDVPDPDKLRQSTGHLNRMRILLRESTGKLEEARNSKDVVRLNCVNEKVMQIKGLLRISEQADVSLQENVSRREQAAAEHEFTKVGIAGQKVEQLRREVEECIGQLAFRTDENLTVDVETPDGLPGVDVTNPPPPPGITVRPPPASPTL